MDPKVRSIVAHFFIVGWVIALVTNNPKDELASYYLRQTLGIHLLGFAGMFLSMFLFFIPFIGMLIGLGLFVLWIMSIIGAASGEQKPFPVLGAQFQEWFKSF